jgi:hypothetical protein
MSKDVTLTVTTVSTDVTESSDDSDKTPVISDNPKIEAEGEVQ